MSTVGIERRWDRTARIGARIGLRGPVALLCAGLVFASFFAIGRATRAGSGTRAESTASPPAASVSAAVPVRLQTAASIETTLLPPPPPPPRPRKAQPFKGPNASAALQAATPEASRTVTPAPRVSEPVTPAPAAAPVRQSTPSRSSGGSSSGGGGHHSSSGSGSGGGTFESSG